MSLTRYSFDSATQMWHYIDLLLLAKPGCLDSYPAVTAFYERVAKLPGVSDYLKERPQNGSEKIGKVRPPCPRTVSSCRPPIASRVSLVDTSDDDSPTPASRARTCACETSRDANRR